MIDHQRPPTTRRRAVTARGRWTAVAVLLALGVPLGACSPGAAADPPAPAPPVAAPATAPLTATDVTAWLDGLVPAGLERSGIPGAAVVVVRDGQVLASRGYGLADTGVGGGPVRAVDPERTLFRFGSVSKVLTATAVLGLVAQGRIDLDTDVRRYLDFPLPLAVAPVTMRHLLTHTAGFEERARGLIRLGEEPADLREDLAVDPPRQVFAPGTTPAYSNYGYGLAGYVVQRVTGTPFAEYLQRAVLAPAGMTSSTFAQPLPPALRDRLARGAATDDDPPLPFETVHGAPAGALTASASDVARFAAAWLAPSSPLLPPAARDLMTRPGLGAADLGGLAAGPRMALGLFDEGRGGRRTLGHGGDTQVFHSHLQLHPDQRLAVVVTTNGSGREGDDSLVLRDAVLQGFADRYVPGAGPVAASTPTAREHAALAEGSYENARAPFSTFLSAMSLLARTTLTARPDGTLLVEPGPLSPRPALYHEIRPWVWQEVGGHRVLAMRLDGDRVSAIGVESAFTLLRTTPARDAALVVPVLAGAAAVLLLALLAWPADAARRRWGRARREPTSRVDRGATGLSRAGAACGLVALGGWSATVVAVSGLTDVPAPALVALVVLQAVAALAVVPAVVAVGTGLRHRVGGTRLVGRLLVVLALVAVAGIALSFGLLGTDLSY